MLAVDILPYIALAGPIIGVATGWGAAKATIKTNSVKTTDLEKEMRKLEIDVADRLGRIETKLDIILTNRGM